MPELFLYETLNVVSSMGFLKKEIPDSVKLNLNPTFDLRDYQIEAFVRFFYCYKTEFPNKTLPLHFLFNMATGSGKTLIMAGLILYLYEQGYRNFLFFVNSTNIIEKTKDNFLNPASIKYLFNHEITIGNQRVRITPVDNFEGVNLNDINICFSTIQQLHIDLTTQKENAITFEDFRKYKIVLIADEAHHMSAATQEQMEILRPTWENTVQTIFEKNSGNLLLEFTATHDYINPAMVNKYRNKVIYRYDLPEFRNDRFSKDVTLVYSDFDLDERIIQALILSQYKQEVAAKYRINLKPVLLFKAQRTIAQSQENKANFHKIIDTLDGKKIANIRKSDILIIQRAFKFFDENKIKDEQLAERIKQEFREEFCLSVNDEEEKVNYQILVNTLEDRNNRIRAIFAVQKLSEGWDVLNLFDIVRCYEPRDTGRAKLGSTTISEAQLIGRGARYFPFVLPENPDRFRRKFDNNLEHELRVIEVLHYHSINNSRYIAEIRAALVEQGIIDENEVTKEIKLKESFKRTRFYKYGLIYTNKSIEKDYQHVKSFMDLGIRSKNYIHVIATGHGGVSTVLDGTKQKAVLLEEKRKDLPLKEIEKNIIYSAIARNPFYTFESIRHYFPNLESMQEFITSDKYLGGLEITFQGNVYQLEQNKVEKLNAVLDLLGEIETEVRQQDTKYEGSREFYYSRIHEVFNDKLLKFSKDNERAKDDAQFENFVSTKDWFAFNTIYGTSEEKAFVRALDRFIDKQKEHYESIYLIRNEGHFAIYNFSDGKAFQPDFVLFMLENSGKSLTYQIFIEPKGGHLLEHDRWKEDFLKEITKEFGSKILKIDEKLQYRLIGVPFYNNEDENNFRENIESALLV